MRLYVVLRIKCLSNKRISTLYTFISLPISPYNYMVCPFYNLVENNQLFHFYKRAMWCWGSHLGLVYECARYVLYHSCYSPSSMSYKTLSTVRSLQMFSEVFFFSNIWEDNPSLSKICLHLKCFCFWSSQPVTRQVGTVLRNSDCGGMLSGEDMLMG